MHSNRNGFTLFEVVLTVVILVIIAAISIPVIGVMMSDSQMTEARDFIQTALTDARSRAMETGVTHHFEIKTREYRIVSDSAEESDLPELAGQLPEKVCFCGVNGDTGSGNGEWQTVATFFPDGTAETDVEIRFQVEGGEPEALKLRAVTGAVTTALLGRPELAKQ